VGVSGRPGLPQFSITIALGETGSTTKGGLPQRVYHKAND